MKDVEVTYRLHMMVESVHGGPQHGEGVPGTVGCAEIFVPRQCFLKVVPWQHFLRSKIFLAR